MLLPQIFVYAFLRGSDLYCVLYNRKGLVWVCIICSEGRAGSDGAWKHELRKRVRA